jgi:uncharacterized protein with HEPN domain
LDKLVLHLLTMLEAIEKIFLYSSRYNSFYDFYQANDQESFNACLNLLVAIGEESKHLPENIKISCNQINWSAVVGLRNHISHNYRGIDPEIVWDIINNELQDLKKILVNSIQQNFNDSLLEKYLKLDYYKHSRRNFYPND